MFIPVELYEEIIKVMPIPCVDLLIYGPSGKILMVERQNRPAKESWWFPGGRVLFGELRKDAATRKLKEECGLSPTFVSEFGTYDVLLDLPGNELSHGITTVYKILVNTEVVSIDKQSSDYEWRHLEEWLRKANNTFVKKVLDSCLR